jgi:hypothetical protein
VLAGIRRLLPESVAIHPTSSYAGIFQLPAKTAIEARFDDGAEISTGRNLLQEAASRYIKCAEN